MRAGRGVAPVEARPERAGYARGAPAHDVGAYDGMAYDVVT
ncbi:hypothetical protein ACKI1O_03175 [Streptomyces scabiei]